MSAPNEASAPAVATPPETRPETPAQTPARTQMHADAEWLANLYPVRHRPAAAAWHPSCIHVPASVRALVEGMPPYGA